MTEAQLEKASQIVGKMKQLRENIKKAEYSQHENVTIREFDLTCIGIENGIKSPESLFRKIGKMIITENHRELKKLEKQFKEI